MMHIADTEPGPISQHGKDSIQLGLTQALLPKQRIKLQEPIWRKQVMLAKIIRKKFPFNWGDISHATDTLLGSDESTGMDSISQITAQT